MSFLNGETLVVLSVEDLNLLWLKLSGEQGIVSRLHADLETLWGRSSYQTWWSSEPRKPFSLADDQSGKLETLEETGLARDGVLRVKVNRIGERVFITDGAWVPHALRVFPDPDEAFALLAEVRERGLDTWAEWVIDPAAGCGHTPLGFVGKARRISCDANARAVLYASLNGLLNGLSTNEFLPVLNNMKNGLPAALNVRGKTLFLANVPFAPAPKLEHALAVNSAGGRSGADLQIASFRLVENFRRETGNPVKACFLTWTLGNRDKNLWEVPEQCREIFPGAKVRWHLVHQDYDAPELANPAPLPAMLDHLARSQYAVRPGDDKVRQAYAELGNELTREGWTHIGYGMLEVDLAQERSAELDLMRA